MPELIYNIENTFDSNNSDGCLYQYGVQKFLIPTYQRGYKWASADENDPVPLLLKDLKNAFDKSNDKKYYLQYITVKKHNQYLEVIDGQQRLTTLSILMSVFILLLEENIVNNIVLNKLDYEIRDSIFKDYIYDYDGLNLFLEKEWDRKDGIILNDVSINNQDVFYIHSAAKKIKQVLKDIDNNNDDLSKFYKYVKENVMLIINAVEFHLPSEKVFKNLNSQKVLLTEEELIKALMLTKLPRTNKNNKKKHYKEITELRASLGRKWDEISVISNEERFSHFFFEEGNGFYALLELIAIKNGYTQVQSSQNNKYPLFNFYNNKSENINELFETLCLYYDVLVKWMNDPEIYNLLGFFFFSRHAKNTNKLSFIKENIEKGKDELISILLNFRLKILPDNPELIKYDPKEKDDIHNILLAMNVFMSGDEYFKFDFYEFSKYNWTLEHIFPQKPEGKNGVLNESQKLKIYEMLGGYENLSIEVKEVLEKESRNDDEKKIYYDVLKSVGPLNEIGNMALLSDSVNSSLSCGFFDEKRNDILKHMQKGKFIPIHTFKVFSKSIFEETPGDFLVWTNEDIKNHTIIIADSINKLKQSQNESR